MRYDYEIIESQRLYDWQKTPQTGASRSQSALPEGAASYLQMSNPRFTELQDRYAAFNNDVTNPLEWKDSHVSPDDMQYFRGDNAYVWQFRTPFMNEMAYALTTYYVKAIDKLGLLDKLIEDDLFGVLCASIDNRLVSRDLLDSIIEIHFLEKHLNITNFKNLTVLDVGAGYGRLAHRMVSALPNIANYLCTDAFPASTFISEYYLRYRNLEDKAKVVPLDEIEQTLRNYKVDLAVNIHSFSECRIPAIEWWLSTLAKNNVKYLMVVPNPLELLTNDGSDFGGVIENSGYKLIAKDFKYRDPVVQKYAINPCCHYLFELR
jgi:putative sugar O-methyltransferase